MVRRAVYIVLLLVAVASPVLAQCIFEAKDGPYDPAAIAVALYTNIPHFSADAVIDIDHHDNIKMPPVKLHYSALGGAVKSEADLTQSLADPSPLVAAGRSSVNTLFFSYSDDIIIQYPDRKGFYRDRVDSSDRFLPVNTKQLFLDKKTFAGHQCRQTLWNVTLANGSRLAVRALEAVDLGLFPVKLTYTTPYTFYGITRTATVTAVFDKIDLNAPRRSQFLPPAGFRSFPDRDMLLSMSYKPAAPADTPDKKEPPDPSKKLDERLYLLGIALPLLVCTIVAALWIKWWIGKR
jgi:hypothetical protein